MLRGSTPPAHLAGVQFLGRLSCSLKRMCEVSKSHPAGEESIAFHSKQRPVGVGVDCNSPPRWKRFGTTIQFPRPSADPSRPQPAGEPHGKTFAVLQAPFNTHMPHSNYEFLKKLLRTGVCTFEAQSPTTAAQPSSPPGSGVNHQCPVSDCKSAFISAPGAPPPLT